MKFLLIFNSIFLLEYSRPYLTSILIFQAPFDNGLNFLVCLIEGFKRHGITTLASQAHDKVLFFCILFWIFQEDFNINVEFIDLFRLFFDFILIIIVLFLFLILRLLIFNLFVFVH